MNETCEREERPTTVFMYSKLCTFNTLLIPLSHKSLRLIDKLSFIFTELIIHKTYKKMYIDKDDVMFRMSRELNPTFDT